MVVAVAGEQSGRLTLIRKFDRRNGADRWLASCSCAVKVRLANATVAVAEAERRLGICAGSISQRVRMRGDNHQQAIDHYVARLARLGATSPTAGTA